MFAGVRRVGLGLVVTAVGVALLTSGCAAGQRAHTAEELPTIPGANADLGSIHLRSALIEPPSGTTAFFPKGSDLSVKLVIVNSGATADTLTGSSITSPAFTSWGSYASTADAAAVVSAAAQPSGSSASAAALPSPAPQITIPAGGRVYWGTPESTAALLFSGTTQDLHPGTTIPVTFTFANAGTVTVAVPIALSLTPNTSVIPAPSTTSIE